MVTEDGADRVKVPLLTLLRTVSSVPGEVVESTGSAPLHVTATANRVLCEAESEKERPVAVA
jgi:hypothetical protein